MLMERLFINIFFFVSVVLLCSCQTERATDRVAVDAEMKAHEQDHVEKAFDVRKFDYIDVSMAIKAVYVPGDYSVKVKADRDVIDLVNVKSRNGKLIVSIRSRGTVTVNSNIYMYVSSPKLRGAGISSAASLDLKNGLPASTNEFSVDASSAGNFHADKLSCSRFRADVSSAGSISVKQLKCNDFEIEASSGGNLMAGRLDCGTADVVASSSANVKLGQTNAETIVCKASSASNVRISGKAKSAKLSVSSGADINASALKANDMERDANTGGGISI